MPILGKTDDVRVNVVVVVDFHDFFGDMRGDVPLEIILVRKRASANVALVPDAHVPVLVVVPVLPDGVEPLIALLAAVPKLVQMAQHVLLDVLLVHERAKAKVADGAIGMRDHVVLVKIAVFREHCRTSIAPVHEAFAFLDVPEEDELVDEQLLAAQALEVRHVHFFVGFQLHVVGRGEIRNFVAPPDRDPVLLHAAGAGLDLYVPRGLFVRLFLARARLQLPFEHAGKHVPVLHLHYGVIVSLRHRGSRRVFLQILFFFYDDLAGALRVVEDVQKLVSGLVVVVVGDVHDSLDVFGVLVLEFLQLVGLVEDFFLVHVDGRLGFVVVVVPVELGGVRELGVASATYESLAEFGGVMEQELAPRGEQARANLALVTRDDGFRRGVAVERHEASANTNLHVE